jgi:hypothetical protein
MAANQRRASDVVDAVGGAIAPHIGANMARSAVLGHCQKLGLGETLDEAQLEQLLQRLAAGLNIFVGREKASQIVADARSAAKAVPTS